MPTRLWHDKRMLLLVRFCVGLLSGAFRIVPPLLRLSTVIRAENLVLGKQLAQYIECLCDVSRDGIADVRAIPMLISDQHEPVPVRADGDGQKVARFLEYLSEGPTAKFGNRGGHVEFLA